MSIVFDTVIYGHRLSQHNVHLFHYLLLFGCFALAEKKRNTNHTTAATKQVCTMHIHSQTHTQYPLPFHIKQCAQVTMNDLLRQHHPFSIWFLFDT